MIVETADSWWNERIVISTGVVKAVGGTHATALRASAALRHQLRYRSSYKDARTL